jgi:hypothetical protein
VQEGPLAIAADAGMSPEQALPDMRRQVGGMPGGGLREVPHRGSSDGGGAGPLVERGDLDLVERSADLPLGATDASIVALAERVETDLLLTLDRRRFGAVRMRDGRPFRLLPE